MPSVVTSGLQICNNLCKEEKMCLKKIMFLLVVTHVSLTPRNFKIQKRKKKKLAIIKCLHKLHTVIDALHKNPHLILIRSKNNSHFTNDQIGPNGKAGAPPL